MVVTVVQIGANPLVDRCSEAENAFEVTTFFPDQLFLKDFRIHDRTLDDHPIGEDRDKQIVQHGKRPEYSVRVQRARHIEQDDIGSLRIIFEKSERIGVGAFRIAFQNGIGLPAYLPVLLYKQPFQNVRLGNEFYFPLPLLMDTSLRGVAIHHKHAQAHLIMQITR